MFAANASRGDSDVVAERRLPQAVAESPIPVRPLSFRELIDLPYALIQANGKRLAGVAITTFLVAEVLVVGVVVAVDQLGGGDTGRTVLVAVLTSLAAAWIARVFVGGAGTVIGVASVLGGPRKPRPAVVALLLAGLVRTVVGLASLVTAAVVAVIFPPAFAGLGWVRARWALTVPVIVAENASYPTASARSALLVRSAHAAAGRVWLVHRLVLLASLLPLAGLIGFISSLSGTQRPTLIALSVGAFLVVAIFAEVVESAARVVAYVDLRCRREAFDIRVPGYPVAAS